MPRIHAPPRVRALTAAMICILPVVAGTANAEVTPYYVGVSESISHDSNLVRAGDDIVVPDRYSKSDSVYATSLLAGFDQSFGRQHGYGTLTVRDSHYAKNKIFNNLGYQGNVGLDWSTVERISGTLTANASRNLTNFDYYDVAATAQTAKDVESAEGVNASVRVGLVTAYSFEVDLGQRRVRNSLDSAKTRDFDQDTGSAGLRWNPRGNTVLGLALRETRGRYPSFQPVFDFSTLTFTGYTADRFKEQAIDLTGSLQPSGASSLDARVSYSKTRYDLNNERDFSGVTGTLGWAWQPRAKLRLNTRLSRDTGQNSYAVNGAFGLPAGTADYSQLSNTFRFQADYDATAKISLTGALQIVQRNIVDTIAGSAASQASGKDTSTLLSLGGRWNPLRSVQVGCDVSTERRRASGALTLPLRDNIFGCFGQFQLQQ